MSDRSTVYEVTSGASMSNSLKHASRYTVMCKIEIENWTKYPLWAPESHINRGIIEYPPVAVMPGKREMFVARKTGLTATGTYGTASWQILGKDKRVVVMWSCPYNFNHYSNWLAVGLTSDRHHNDWFDQMYYKESGRGLNFTRGEYYYDTNIIKSGDKSFEVIGNMGTSHHTTAQIIVRPLHERDRAPEQ